MEGTHTVNEPLDLIRLSLDDHIFVKCRGDRTVTGKLHAYDSHLNMIIGDAEEILVSSVMDPETGTKRSLEISVGETPIVEYISIYSGVRVLIVSVERPLVDGIFVIPTEAHDDDGCAHALEHLIFFGSEHYPHNQVLDAMASRCLAEGTNAWTEVDHTAFTFTTAGSSGFLNLLPVFIDHLLHPLLSEHAFVTEVHHVNASGKNDGVLYSEMRDFEHDCECVVERTLKEYLYPGDSGYRYETGGRLEPLRDLTNDKVKKFHKKFYRWSNLSIIVVGKIPIDDLLSCIIKCELSDPLSSNGNPTTRVHDAPWMSPIPSPNINTGPISVKFPSNDSEDDMGEIVWGWRGPEWINFLERHIVECLGEYLTHTNASPLQKALVEVKTPFAGSVEFDEEPFKSTMYSLRFCDVPRHRSHQLGSAVRTTLQRLVLEGFDMGIMRATIERTVALFRQNLEENPEEGYAQPLIEYVVNCPIPNASVLEELWAIESHFYGILIKKSKEFWNNKLQEYFLSSKPVQVIGMPDRKLAKRLGSAEKTLIKHQLQSMQTKGGIEVIERRIAEAKAFHDAKPPFELIQSIPIAEINSVQQFHFTAITNFEDMTLMNSTQYDNSEQQIRDALEEFPFPVHFCCVNSEFAELRAVVRIPELNDGLSEEEGSLIQLLVELLFETHVGTDYLKKSLIEKDENDVIDHEAFSQILLSHLTDHSCTQGVSGTAATNTAFPELITVSVSCEKEKFVEASEILLAALKSTRFTTDRLLSIAKQMLGATIRKRRQGKTIAAQIELGLRYGRKSLRMFSSLPMRQSILRRIIISPRDFIPKLTNLYNKLFHTPPKTLSCGSQTRFALQIISSKDAFIKFKNPLNANLKLLYSYDRSTHAPFKPLPEILNLRSTMADRVPQNSPLPFGNGILSTSASHDAGIVMISAPGALGQDHPDNANLTVLCEHMSSCEGPLFKAVRGNGFAYSTFMAHSLSTGEIFFHLLSASDPVTALNVSFAVFKEYSCFTDINEIKQQAEAMINSSKCSTLFHIIRGEATAFDYALARFNNVLLGRPANYTEVLLKQIQSVTAESVIKTAKKYLSQFLEIPLSSNSYLDAKTVVIVTNKENINEVESKLKTFAPFKTKDDNAHMQRVDFSNFAAWIVSGDETDTNSMKPVPGEEEMVSGESDSENDDNK